MLGLRTIERVRSYVPYVRGRGERAQTIIRDHRKKHPLIRDRIHGLLPDTRSLPSPWKLGILLELNKWERKLQFLVEREHTRLHHF